jgi:hypothetical protein
MATSRSSTSAALSVFNSQAKAKLNWNDLVVINPAYIDELEKRFNGVYSLTLAPHLAYSEADVKALVVSKYFRDLPANKFYNPLQLPIAPRLSSNGNFFREHTIKSSKDSLGKDDVIDEKEAVIRYLEFMKQYSLAYIDYLKAINGSKESLQAFVEKFITLKMFEAARINMKVFQRTEYDNKEFLLGILANLMLHVLFSKDSQITTVARVRALEIIHDNFDLDKLTNGFRSCAGENYNLNSLFAVKPEVFDLIPKAFVTKREESGHVNQSDLFLKNVTIVKIFQINPNLNLPDERNLNAAISDIITNYRAHAIHILHGALRCITLDEKVFPRLFASIIGLSKLDSMQKEEIFGDDASYRNGGNSVNNAQVSIDTIMRLESDDDNRLGRLTKEELIQRIRQDAARIHQLEAELREAIKERALNSSNPQGLREGSSITNAEVNIPAAGAYRKS